MTESEKHGHCNPGKRSSGDPKDRRNSLLGILGLCCSGICLLGLPLLAFMMPAMKLGWFHDERIVWAIVLLSLGMYGLGLWGSVRRHGRRAPLLVALAGAAVLVGATGQIIPAWGGVIALVLLFGAWCWNRSFHTTARKEDGAPSPTRKEEPEVKSHDQNQVA